MTVLRKVCLLLSGCGGMDGSDVVETVLVASALAHRGISVSAVAPDGPQFHVMDHGTGLSDGSSRQSAVEAARFGIGPILSPMDIDRQVDAVVIPGGTGGIVTLCTVGHSGLPPTVHSEIASWLVGVHRQQIPIAAMGLSALLLVAAFSEDPPEVTVGNDAGLAAMVTAMNGIHHNCNADAVWVDARRRIVTLPGRLMDADAAATSRGIDRMISALGEFLPLKDGGFR